MTSILNDLLDNNNKDLIISILDNMDDETILRNFLIMKEINNILYV